jgi:RNA polymerase sigma factor for flagellar operon FliA
MENAEILWQEYSKTKSIEIREKLIIQYAPLVKYVAGRVLIHISTTAPN